MGASVPSRTRKKIEWLLRRAEGALLPDALLAEEGAHLDPRAAAEKLAASALDVEAVGAAARVAALAAATDAGAGSATRAAYVATHGVAGVQRFPAGAGARVYLLGVETFPRHVNNVYVVLEPGSACMLDCGSGFPSARRDLALGFAVLRAVYGEETRYEALDHVVVSHAHLDHFGGANLVKTETRARLAVHELDARVLECWDERLIVAAKDCDVYWRRAGVDDAARAEMLELYTGTKQLFTPQAVDVRLRDGDRVGPGYVVHHVPGHCPGLVCLQVHDVLLTSDHVLARTTPHQFPQAITPFGGLEHYFTSLERVAALPGVRLALGGHEEPVEDLPARCAAIAAFHRARLGRVLELCRTPRSILDVTGALFAGHEGYGRILAIEEAGAHVEYLHQIGKLRIANLDEVARARDPVIQYVARG